MLVGGRRRDGLPRLKHLDFLWAGSFIFFLLKMNRSGSEGQRQIFTNLGSHLAKVDKANPSQLVCPGSSAWNGDCCGCLGGGGTRPSPSCVRCPGSLLKENRLAMIRKRGASE